MKLTVLVASAAIALAMPALAAGHCNEDLKAIDTALAKAKLSDADIDPHPERYSFITRIRSGYGPGRTGLQTHSV